MKPHDHATHDADNKATEFSSSNFTSVLTKLGVGERNATNCSSGIIHNNINSNNNNNNNNGDANLVRRSSQMPYAQNDVHRTSHHTLGQGRHNEEWMYCLDKLEEEHSQQNRKQK